MPSLLQILLFLIFFPLAAALVVLAVRNTKIRGGVIIGSALVLTAASILLAISMIGHEGAILIDTGAEWIDLGMLAVSLLMSLYIIIAGIRDKRYWATVLAVVQIIASISAEFVMRGGAKAENTLMLDTLSLIMILLVGVVGGLICVFAVGYMQKYHHHKQIPDKSGFFFTVIFVFLSAMFGLVVSNSLMWVLFFWEITTFCSYLLIGYTRKEEAINNSYRALIMNMVGGLSFLAGIVWLSVTQGVVELDKLMMLSPEAALIPAVLISFSGIVKSAQFPFNSWLLGAMVAPTPTSALLHSSTMVKAGVYIIIRLSPVLKDTNAGLMIALIGGVTFLAASLIAITKHNVKKLLAYSTISTLGLIVLCAGVGTYQAIWTAILLMIFHAVAKSLLFLSVGTVEHGIESLNIEDMDGLILRMPKVTVCLLTGIAGMFIAPFGMLISKWAALEALIEANPLLAVFVVFGSSATLFFYTKWMGKLIMIIHPSENQEKHISGDEWFTMGTLSVLTVLICLAFPLISSELIEPYIRLVYQHDATMAAGNILIMLIMLGLLLLLPLQILLQNKQKKHVNAYLCGANITENEIDYEANTRYHTAGRNVEELKLRNYYFEDLFGEGRVGKYGLVISVLLLVVLFGVALI